MQVTVQPGLLEGSIAAIPSKSHAHRVLVCAALADRPSQIHLTRSSEDIDATMACLQALGADLRYDGELVHMHPIRELPAASQLDAAESGTTLRLLLPVAAALGLPCEISAAGRLPERPLTELIDALTEAGAHIDDNWPLKVHGPLKAGFYEIPGNISSQYISGLLLAAPLIAADVSVRLTSPLESRPYVDLTTAVMADFGVEVYEESGCFHVPGGQTYRAPAEPISIEGDWSQAAFFLVAGALGGPVRVHNLQLASMQGDKDILLQLASFGARLDFSDQCVCVSAGSERMPLSLSLSAIPDLLPILSVLAAGALGDSIFEDAGRLRYKESDRLDSSEAMIQALAGEASTTEDSLRVSGSGRLHGGEVDAYGDHRIVMAASIAAALCEEPVTIHGAEAVAKSYPAFFQDLQSLGGVVHEL